MRRGSSVLIGGAFERLFCPEGGGNLNKPIFKSSNARGLPGGGGMLNFRIDRRITLLLFKTPVFVAIINCISSILPHFGNVPVVLKPSHKKLLQDRSGKRKTRN